MNGISVPVKHGIPMLMNIANSMTATSTIGSDIEPNTQRMIMNIAPMDTVLTDAKSLSVIVIRSFVQGASPTSMFFSLYESMVLSISVH